MGPKKAQKSPHTPAGLQMPKPGTPTYLPPSGPRSASTSLHQTASPSPQLSREGSPLRIAIGTAANSENWLSMKHPDLLSAADRVTHHNMTNIALRLDAVTKGLMQFASRGGGGSGGKAVLSEEEAAVQAQDNKIAETLEEERFKGVLRDQMNQFKGEMGSLSGKKGKPATKQAKALVDKFAELTAQEQMEQADQMRDAGDDSEVQEQPFTEIHASLSGFSENGLVAWYLELVKQLGLGPKTAGGRPKKDGSAQKESSAQAKAGEKRRRTSDDAEEDGSDEDGEVTAPGRNTRASTKRTKRSTATGGASGEGSDEDEEEA